MGLVGLPKLYEDSNVRVANYGGKIVVLWKGMTGNFRRWDYTRKICCAQIALERRNNREIWGKLEWLDHVLTVPVTSRLVKVLAATV